VEIYQNCPIFNDGAFDGAREPASGIPLRHGKPIVFGPDKSLAVSRNPGAGALEVIDRVAEALLDDTTADDPSVAIGLPSLRGHVTFGMFRARPGPPTTISCASRVYATMDTALPTLARCCGSDG
jgi:2-oxoglutarate ferredoxin oxidoreductase subunit beta